MINFRVSSGIRKLTARFKDLGQGRLLSFSNFCALFTLFLFGFDDLSKTVRGCPWTHSVSDLSRAIQGFDGNRFMRRLRKSILRKYKGQRLNPDDFCYAIDDTDNPKYGKGIFRHGRWKGSKGKYLGQKVLVIALIDIKRGIAIPLSYDIVAKKDDPDYKSGLDLGIENLKKILECGFPKIPVVGDSWFDSVSFFKDLKNLGLHYAGEIKSNRRVRNNPGINVKWKKLPQLFRKMKRSYVLANPFKEKSKRKWFAESTLFIKNYSSPLKGVAVYNRKNGIDAFAYYVSTDLTMTGEKLWKYSRARWKIECLFRDLKQNLSFGRLPCAGEKAADLAICMPFSIYISLRLDEVNFWGLDSRESIGKMVLKIRENELNRSIEVMLSGSDLNLIEKAKARRQLKKINQKPVNTTAEKNKNHFRQAG